MKKSEFWSRYKYLIFFIIIFSISGVSIFKYVLTPEKKLPVYSPSMVNADLVSEDIQYKKKYHKISNFEMINQNNELVTEKNYDNTIYVADFFFTTCPSICPIMTGNMVFLQNELEQQDVMFASFSVTPEIDSVEVLKKYAIEKGVDDSRWNLMTGNKEEIYSLARKSYLVAKENPNAGSHDMIHTENFVLVDREKRIRGYYDGTSIDDMNLLLSDIEILIESYK
tara:strand:+ start:134 stop:808 length:675 start_codon:yes stop_codon:yes gene_type:complete